MARDEVRQRLLETGGELIHLQGFNHTGIQEILKKAGVPKGSFYFYFDNKEDFGLQLVDHYGRQYRDVLAEIEAKRGGDPIEELRLFFEAFLDYFESQGYTRGCLLGNLAGEMGDLSPAFRKKLREAMDSLAEPIRSRLARARDAGVVPGDLDPAETAWIIVHSWHGALLRMKIEKGPEPYRQFQKFVFERLLK